MGILSGLKGLGLGGLENLSIFEEEKSSPEPKKEEKKPTVSAIQEKDLIFDKGYECPVCDSKFTAKILKTGKVKIGLDSDLRPRAESIDPNKYDVIMCPICGYAVLGKYFGGLTPAQSKLIKEKISMSVQLKEYSDESYSYEQALERYQLALACAVVKHSKISERAYTCLKAGWVARGWKESLITGGEKDSSLIKTLEDQENEYLRNAYNGFVEANLKETYPICGMDKYTMSYLLSVLAIRFREYDTAAKLISEILASNTVNPRIKDKARELKQQLIELKKK